MCQSQATLAQGRAGKNRTVVRFEVRASIMSIKVIPSNPLKNAIPPSQRIQTQTLPGGACHRPETGQVTQPSPKTTKKLLQIPHPTLSSTLFTVPSLRLKSNGIEHSVVGGIPTGTFAEGIDGDAWHLDVLTVELAHHVHAGGVLVGGFKFLWLVELGVRHVASCNLAGRLADARGRLVVNRKERVITWHHEGGLSTSHHRRGATVHKHGLSRWDTTAEAAGCSHHDWLAGWDTTSDHHRLLLVGLLLVKLLLVGLLRNDGHDGGGSRAGLQRDCYTLGCL